MHIYLSLYILLHLYLAHIVRISEYSSDLYNFRNYFAIQGESENEPLGLMHNVNSVGAIMIR